MKKYIILTLLFFILIPASLFAQDWVQQKNSFLIPLAEGALINLANHYRGVLFDFASCIEESDNSLKISQKDIYGKVWNDGYAQTFYFIKKDTANPTDKQKKPFTIVFDRYNCAIQSDGSISITNTEARKTYAKEEIAPVGFNKKEGNVFQSSEFLMDLYGENETDEYGQKLNIEPGEYEATLTLTYLYKDSVEDEPHFIERKIYLKAFFEQESIINDIQYFFSYTPYPASTSINLREEIDYIPISNISFYSIMESSIMPSLSEDQHNNRFKLVISTVRDYPLTSSKKGTLINPESNRASNLKYSIDYTLEASGANVISNTGGCLTLSVDWITQNKKFTRFERDNPQTVYIQEYKLDKDIKILLDPTVDRSILAAGQYTSTLYYFVICND